MSENHDRNMKEEIENKVEQYIAGKRLFRQGDIVVVAVSGGPDSLVLLNLLQKMSLQLQLKPVIAHLNHCMRPEAEEEQSKVKSIAENFSLPFEGKAVDVRALKRKKGISEEEAGRLARYSFFREVAAKYGASKIALGHHRDDLAETVLLNIFRGTGVDGLAGILPLRSWGDVFLVRPLLCLRRSEIEAYCREEGLDPVTDSTNLQKDYTRNRIRLELIPELENNYNPRIREALASLADLAAEDRALLQGLARRYYRKLVRPGRHATSINARSLSLLPPAVRKRLLLLSIARHTSLQDLGRAHLERVNQLLERKKRGRRLSLPGGVSVFLEAGDLVIAAAHSPLKKPFEALTLRVPGKTVLPGRTLISADLAQKSDIAWPPPACRAYLDYAQLPRGPLTVRPRWPGARFFPQGAPGSKKLKDFIIDRKVPQFRRDSLPLITVGDEIVWVAGLRIAHPYRVTARTERVLVLEYRVSGKRL